MSHGARELLRLVQAMEHASLDERLRGLPMKQLLHLIISECRRRLYAKIRRVYRHDT